MLKIVITTAITLCAFALGMALLFLQGEAFNKMEQMKAENANLLKQREALIRENEMLFSEHVNIENRIDSLIYSDTPQDSVLMKLYNIRHRE